jgi:molybdopterin-guanine dinucleotide biosynthesis protein A
MKVCGVILSGGKSSRMGTNKSLLPIKDKTAIEWISAELNTCTDKVVLIANAQEPYLFLHLETYGDRYTDKGPLAGLESALYHIDAPLFVIAACDMPFVNSEVYNYLLEQLGDHDAVVPIYNNQIHPLAAIYRKNVLPKIQHQLKQNNLKVRGFFNQIKVNYICDFPTISTEILEKHFFNINNPAQYEEAKNF